MDNNEFKSLLKKAGLSKKRFSELVETSHQAVNNWNNKDRGIPYWVKSWLNLYIKNKDCEELKEIIKENVCKD